MAQLCSEPERPRAWEVQASRGLWASLGVRQACEGQSEGVKGNWRTFLLSKNHVAHEA